MDFIACTRTTDPMTSPFSPDLLRAARAKADGIVALAINDAVPHVSKDLLLLHWRVQRALEQRITAALVEAQQTALSAALSDPSAKLVEAALQGWLVEVWGHPIRGASTGEHRAMRAAMIEVSRHVTGRRRAAPPAEGT